MENVKVEKSRVKYHCFVCGNKLNQYDYCRADDMCSTCRGSRFSSSNYIEKDGSNKVDVILTEKITKSRG